MEQLNKHFPGEKFNRTLAKYYEKWYRDCWDSALWCLQKAVELPVTDKNWYREAKIYLIKKDIYFDIINRNWQELNEAIEEEKKWK